MPSKKKPETPAEDKVFDVAKPGSTEPETGTKPMVVGHKSMASDPSIVEKAKDSNDSSDTPEETETKTTDEPSIGLSASKKLTLKPMKSIEDAANIDDSTQKSPSKPSDDEDKELEDTTLLDTMKNPEDLEKKKQEEVDEKEAQLQELIKSGKYTVSIRESHGLRAKVFLATFIILAVCALIVAIVLIDAELIDVDIDLPFDIL